MTDEMQFVVNQTAKAERITHSGREYLKVPVIAIKAGVLNGELVPAEEIGRHVDSWAGRPVPIGHAYDEAGNPVTVNTPDRFAQSVAQFWNPRFEDDALKGEIWIDILKAKTLGGDALTALQRLEANQMTEVSTGYFRDIQPEPGEHNGKPYQGIARNLRPDHLALLLGETGACSIADGCGAMRTNERNGDVQINETELGDRLGLIRRAFREQVTGNDEEPSHTDVIGIFDSTLIAKNWLTKRTQAYDYEMADDGAVTFEDPVDVEVVYRAKGDGAEVVVANQENGIVITTDANQQVADQTFVTATLRNVMKSFSSLFSGEKNMKDKLIKTLVANERCKCTQEQLAAMDDETLQAFHDSLVANEEPEEQPEPEPTPEPQPAQTPPELVELRTLLPELKEFAAQLKANSDQERKILVEQLMTNERCLFDEQDLETMDTSHLQKLAQTLRPTDYSGRGMATHRSGADEVIVGEMPMPEFVVKEQ